VALFGIELLNPLLTRGLRENYLGQPASADNQKDKRMQE
jgi:hypothetical protein